MFLLLQDAPTTPKQIQPDYTLSIFLLLEQQNYTVTSGKLCDNTLEMCTNWCFNAASNKWKNKLPIMPHRYLPGWVVVSYRILFFRLRCGSCVLRWNAIVCTGRLLFISVCLFRRWRLAIANILRKWFDLFSTIWILDWQL